MLKGLLCRECRRLPWHIGIHSKYAIQKDNDAQYRGRDEQLGINTKPSKIEPNLLPKVLPVQRKATTCQRNLHYTQESNELDALSPLHRFNNRILDCT